MELVPLTKYNYLKAVKLCVAPEQEKFVGTVADAIADAHFCDDCEMRALEVNREFVGFIMWQGPHLSRLLIDCHHQRKGYGTMAVKLFIETFPGRQVTLQTKVDNTAAIALYTNLGFKSIADHGGAVYMVR